MIKYLSFDWCFLSVSNTSKKVCNFLHYTYLFIFSFFIDIKIMKYFINFLVFIILSILGLNNLSRMFYILTATTKSSLLTHLIGQ